MMKVILDGVSIQVTNRELELKMKSVLLGTTIKREYVKKKYKWFTDEEKKFIITEAQKGFTAREIAKKMGRSIGGVTGIIKKSQ